MGLKSLSGRLSETSRVLSQNLAVRHRPGPYSNSSLPACQTLGIRCKRKCNSLVISFPTTAPLPPYAPTPIKKPQSFLAHLQKYNGMKAWHSHRTSSESSKLLYCQHDDEADKFRVGKHIPDCKAIPTDPCIEVIYKSFL